MTTPNVTAQTIMPQLQADDANLKGALQKLEALSPDDPSFSADWEQLASLFTGFLEIAGDDLKSVGLQDTPLQPGSSTTDFSNAAALLTPSYENGDPPEPLTVLSAARTMLTGQFDRYQGPQWGVLGNPASANDAPFFNSALAGIVESLEATFSIPSQTATRTDLVPYAVQICIAAMNIQQSECETLLAGVSSYTTEKLQLSQQLSYLQQMRPGGTDPNAAAYVVPNSDAAKAAAMKSILEQYGIDDSDIGSDNQLTQSQFDGLVTRVQNVMDQCDQSQQKAMVEYNQHNSNLNTMSDLLSKIVETWSSMMQGNTANFK